MQPAQSTHFALSRAAFQAVLATIVLLAAAAQPASAASSNDGQPLVLDTERGISDGQSGTVLQTAPLSHERIAQARSPAKPTELTPDTSSPPIVVEPYLQWPPSGGGPTPHPQPHPVAPAQ
jgi:hypothetical protein